LFDSIDLFVFKIYKLNNSILNKKRLTELLLN
jgi:hypothetical protein